MNRQRVLSASGGMIVLAWSILTLSGCASNGGDSGWVELVNGRDLTGWRAMDPAHNAWKVASRVELDKKSDDKAFIVHDGEGMLVNGAVGKTTNLFTEMTHGDCEAHIEFMVPKGSNSGVYFQGRYEIQILDSYGKEKVEFSDCGGIYARWINETNVEGHAPMVNASKAPGEWQTFDAVFLAPRFDDSGKKVRNAKFVKVLHNGRLVHENLELNGPTRAAMDENVEVKRGPLMIQGDHGPVAFRSIRIRPLRE